MWAAWCGGCAKGVVRAGIVLEDRAYAKTSIGEGRTRLERCMDWNRWQWFDTPPYTLAYNCLPPSGYTVRRLERRALPTISARRSDPTLFERRRHLRLIIPFTWHLCGGNNPPITTGWNGVPLRVPTKPIPSTTPLTTSHNITPSHGTYWRRAEHGREEILRREVGMWVATSRSWARSERGRRGYRGMNRSFAVNLLWWHIFGNTCWYRATWR